MVVSKEALVNIIYLFKNSSIKNITAKLLQRLESPSCCDKGGHTGLICCCLSVILDQITVPKYHF